MARAEQLWDTKLLPGFNPDVKVCSWHMCPSLHVQLSWALCRPASREDLTLQTTVRFPTSGTSRALKLPLSALCTVADGQA